MQPNFENAKKFTILLRITLEMIQIKFIRTHAKFYVSK